MRQFCLFALAFLACVVSSLHAEFWTNQAGRVMEGKLNQFDGVTVTILKTNGVRLQIPLTALCEADQRRVRAQTGQSIAPLFVQAAYRDALTVLAQFDRLPPEQKSEDNAIKARRTAQAVFDARLKPRMRELQQPDVRQEIKRLRFTLAPDPP